MHFAALVQCSCAAVHLLQGGKAKALLMSNRSFLDFCVGSTALAVGSLQGCEAHRPSWKPCRNLPVQQIQSVVNYLHEAKDLETEAAQQHLGSLVETDLPESRDLSHQRWKELPCFSKAWRYCIQEPAQPSGAASLGSLQQTSPKGPPLPIAVHGYKDCCSLIIMTCLPALTHLLMDALQHLRMG